ncbi:hypothetical protein ANMWB30_09490 [Arthrobacter sp. MWB30]|nr:hypothetical protein ANMWB30_09490 [Arthrobacter sp. MWB30]
MSVHSLASSDFGLDLHAYLPVGAPFAECEVQPDSDPWEISSLPVNFQVKTTSDRGKEPAVDVATLREWVLGSHKTPVFVLVAHIDDSTSPFQPYSYISPAGLKSLYDSRRAMAKTRILKYKDPKFAFQWDRRAFYAQAWLWTVAPTLMRDHADLIALPDTYESGRTTPYATEGAIQNLDLRVQKTLAMLAHVHLHHFLPRNQRVTIKTVRSLVNLLADVYDGRHSNNDAPLGIWTSESYAVEQISRVVMTNLRGRRPKLSVGAYTSSNDPDEALEDLRQLVGILALLQPRRTDMKFHPGRLRV